MMDWDLPEFFLFLAVLVAALAALTALLYALLRLCKLVIPKSKYFDDRYIRIALPRMKIARRVCLIIMALQAFFMSFLRGMLMNEIVFLQITGWSMALGVAFLALFITAAIVCGQLGDRRHQYGFRVGLHRFWHGIDMMENLERKRMSVDNFLRK